MGDDSGGAAAAFASQLAARWVRDTPEQRHRRLEGSLVSADLSGFTAMSERLAEHGKEGAERLTNTVNGCFTSLISAADLEGGDVLKFGGDALLVWFDGDDHATRAARAAARMQHAIGAARFARSGLRMSVGAHRDQFDLFLVGRPDWRELILAGAPVTTTVDLEAAASAGQALVSEAMAAALPAEWLGEPHEDGRLLRLDVVPRPRRAPASDPPLASPALMAPRLWDDVRALAGTGGEHRLATVVFAELEGTDATLATIGPEAFTEILDRFVLAAQDASDRFGAQLLYTDVIADGVKTITSVGAPTSTGEDEEAGLRFAHELVSACADPPARGGVNRGRIFAGYLGSPTRRTYTVMGDPVNLAARLMARAGAGEVVASLDVLHRARSHFETTDLPPFLVKGKTEPIVAALVGAPTGEHRARQAERVPLVGRDEERRILTDAITAAVDGRGQVVEVVGDAGIGKTRLLEAIVDDPRLVRRIATECQPYDTLSPYASAGPLLRRALGIPDGAAPADAGRQLVGSLERAAPELVPLAPLVAVPLGAEVDPTPEASAIAEEFRTERTHQVVAEMLARTLTVPTVLVVEDVYYIDDASLRLLRAVAGTVTDRPWLLIVTRRPEGPGLVVGPADGHLLKLSPLPPTAALELAAHAARHGAIGSLHLDQMAERSGGNPLFVLQLVDAAGHGVDADDLPESIERLVATRIDRLSPDDRALIRQAAVLGRVFHPSLLNTLRAVDGLPLVAVDRWDAMADLVEPEDERRWRFRHALFRDVAYEGLPFARRARMHHAVGELLEAGVAGVPDVALLSQHFWLAGDAERTWRYSVAAGAAAWANLAVAESIAAYRRALDVRRRVRPLAPDAVSPVAEALGDVFERAARYEEAEEAYRVARRAATGPAADRDRARLSRKVGTILERRGDFAGAIRRYQSALARLEGGSTADVAERAELELVLAGSRHRQGRHQVAYAEATAALTHAEAAGSARLQAMAHNLLQVAISHGGGPRGDDHGRQALELFEAIGDVRWEAVARLNLGIEHQLRGAWSPAAVEYERSAEAFRRAGDSVYEAIVRNNRAELLSDQGHLDAARAEWDQVRRPWEVAGYGMGLAVLELNLGRLDGRAGDPRGGAKRLRDAMARFTELGSASYLLEAQVRLAECLVLAGDPKAARRELDAVDGRREGVEVFGYTMAAAHRVRGWALAQQGQMVEARAAMDASLLAARADDAPFDVALALAARALLDDGDATPSSEAAALFEGLGVVQVVPVPLPLTSVRAPSRSGPTR